MKRIRPCRLVSPLILCLCMSAIVNAEPPTEASPSEKNSTIGQGSEWYLGPVAAYRRISGDFDGNRFYMNDTAVAVVPTVDSAGGWGLVLGLKSRAFDRVSIGIEATFLQSRHSGQWAGLDFDSVQREVDLDFKIFGSPRKKLQPYFLLGMGFPSLEVKNGGALTNGGTTDATYRGFGLNAGVGLLYYLNDHFSVHIQPTLRSVRYDELEMNENVGELNEPLDTSEFNVQIGTTFRFKIGA